MTKRRGKRREKGNGRGSRPDPRETRLIDKAGRLIEDGRAEEALELIEPALERRPESADLHFTRAYAREALGDLWGAVEALEEARAHSDSIEIALPLAGLYVELGLVAHSVRVLRELDRRRLPPLVGDGVRETLASAEKDLAWRAGELGRPVEELEEGFLLFERGRRPLILRDFSTAIEANRRAVEILGHWPPPHNNLAQALLLDGRPDEGLDEIDRSLASEPGNLHALALAIRHLAWFGREDEARELWPRLEKAVPGDLDERMQKAKAAAALREHQAVYQTLKPGVTVPEDELVWGSFAAHELLGIAEANTGRREEARGRLRVLEERDSLARETMEGLRSGRRGTGWADSFRYFEVLELLPAHARDAFLTLAKRGVDVDLEGFRQDLKDFAEQYPQVVRMLEKLIWEEQLARKGLELLWVLGTESACAVLDRFASSQVGPDEARLQALGALADAGRIELGEKVRVWLNGNWQQVSVSSEPQGPREQASPLAQVADLVSEAVDLLHRDELDQAEELLRRAIELRPDTPEAFNNLSLVYARRGDFELAERMLERAVEIAPHYAHAAVNLAGYHLDEGRIDEAEELLAPLSDGDAMTPETERFYEFTRARVLFHRREFSAARKLLKRILKAWPDYEPARDALERIELCVIMERLADDFVAKARIRVERRETRDGAWRKELQRKLTTLAPTLERALPLYHKDALQAMAEIWMPEGGWSQLRKAELVDDIIYETEEEGKLRWVVANLKEEDLDALEAVVERGGVMAWDAFDERFGNDLEESRRWRQRAPVTTMGRLRMHGLLVEATVDDQLYVVIPIDIRETVSEIVRSISRD